MIWDIIKQDLLLVQDLREIKGNVINIMTEISNIYHGGILLLDDQEGLYEYSIQTGGIT